MNDLSPPGYSRESESESGSILVNLSPPPDSTTFLVGYLGHGQASIAGDVQVKLAQSHSHVTPSCSRLVVKFSGIEHRLGADPILLCEQSQVIWGEGAASTSTASGPHPDFPPATSSFKLGITPDLPVCLHLGSSSIEYSITSELHFSDPSIAPIARCAPVHLRRTGSPTSPLADINPSSYSASAGPSLVPLVVATSDPIAFSLRLQRNVFRTGEPVQLSVRVEVPTAKAVGEGLRLRTVSAELVRTIHVNSMPEGSSGPETVAREAPHRTVLAHSGKSARFSPSRPIVIKLTLHPPAELACEAITQSTILHSVSFSVVVTVGIFNVNVLRGPSRLPTSLSASTDAVLAQPIFVIPSLPSSRTDKQKEAELEMSSTSLEGRGGWIALTAQAPRSADSPGEGFDGPVPSYVEHGADDPGIPSIASGSNSSSWLQRGFSDDEIEDEDEYDGYEELSIPVSEAGPPPPGIDDDVSPPSASETNHRTASPLLDSERDDEGDDLPPNDFGQFPRHSPLSPMPSSPSEPSSPPPPLSPLSSDHHGSIYELAPRLVSSPPPSPPRLANQPTLSPYPTRLAFSDHILPPPYVGSPPLTEPPPPPSRSPLQRSIPLSTPTPVVARRPCEHSAQSEHFESLSSTRRLHPPPSPPPPLLPPPLPALPSTPPPPQLATSTIMPDDLNGIVDCRIDPRSSNLDISNNNNNNNSANAMINLNSSSTRQDYDRRQMSGTMTTAGEEESSRLLLHPTATVTTTSPPPPPLRDPPPYE